MVSKVFALIFVFFFLQSSFLSVNAFGSNETLAESGLDYCWSFGDSFPMVDGQCIFPPFIPLSAVSPNEPLWYAGSLCTWNTNHTAQTVGVTLTTPNSAPRSDEFYYVLLSVFDSAGSYDQIGFSNNHGSWGLTNSWTTGPANNLTFHYFANNYWLFQGVTYSFNISAQNGMVKFACYQGDSKIWSSDVPTGGDYLILSKSYEGYPNYMNYEEIWHTSENRGTPDFDFKFISNNWRSLDGTINASTDWTPYYWSAPVNVNVEITNSDVLINNHGKARYVTNPNLPWLTIGSIALAVTIVAIIVAIALFVRKKRKHNT
jgi:hypothetical protein